MTHRTKIENSRQLRTKWKIFSNLGGFALRNRRLKPWNKARNFAILCTNRLTVTCQIIKPTEIVSERCEITLRIMRRIVDEKRSRICASLSKVVGIHSSASSFKRSTSICAQKFHCDPRNLPQSCLSKKRPLQEAFSSHLPTTAHRSSSPEACDRDWWRGDTTSWPRSVWMLRCCEIAFKTARCLQVAEFRKRLREYKVSESGEGGSSPVAEFWWNWKRKVRPAEHWWRKKRKEERRKREGAAQKNGRKRGEINKVKEQIKRGKENKRAES